MRIARANTARQEVAAALTWLQSHLFPSDPALDVHTGHWWIAREDGAPVAFAALLPVSSWSETGYMARCGVLPAFRGQGLQRKLLAHREAYARRLGMLRVITTTYDNPASANNLIRSGYLTYRPQQKWGAANTIYWLKTL
jgi:GNAT superfamily N-acetyltransferase